MALPSNRQELRDWCLRKLGAPVLEINIDEDQIEDRIDEALEFFQQYHFDGVERIPLKHQVTPSSMILSAPPSGFLGNTDYIVGQTSEARGKVVDLSTDQLTLRYLTKLNQFIPGEDFIAEGSGVTGTISSVSNAITIGDMDRGYFDLPPHIISVFNVLPITTGVPGGARMGMFDIRYQFALNQMYNLTSFDLISYDMFKSYIALWEYEFHGIKGVRFNKKTDKLYIDVNWHEYFSADDYIIAETWRALLPTDYPKIWSDYFVREYALALIKQQWGTNLKKFSGIQLIGGVTLNGQQIFDEAQIRIRELEEKVHLEYQLPPDPMIG